MTNAHRWTHRRRLYLDILVRYAMYSRRIWLLKLISLLLWIQYGSDFQKMKGFKFSRTSPLFGGGHFRFGPPRTDYVHISAISWPISVMKELFCRPEFWSNEQAAITLGFTTQSRFSLQLQAKNLMLKMKCTKKYKNAIIVTMKPRKHY